MIAVDDGAFFRVAYRHGHVNERGDGIVGSVGDGEMRIAVDFDGVIADFHSVLCANIRERHGIEYRPRDIDEWNPRIEGAEVSLLEEVEPLVEDERALRETEPVTGVARGLERLRAVGHECVVATHRPDPVLPAVGEWLDDRDIPHDGLLADVPQNKGRIDADVLIDDRPKNVLDAIAAGMSGIHFVGTIDCELPGEGGVEPVRAKSWTEAAALLTDGRE